MANASGKKGIHDKKSSMRMQVHAKKTKKCQHIPNNKSDVTQTKGFRT